MLARKLPQDPFPGCLPLGTGVLGEGRVGILGPGGLGHGLKIVDLGMDDLGNGSLTWDLG